MTADDLLSAPQGDFALTRLHDVPGSPLRAWDAADAYVLDHLGSLDLDGRDLVVVNDAHGALAVALAPHRPTSITDSFVSELAAIANLARNGCDASSVRFASTLDALPDAIDVLVVKVPKTLALLDHQLQTLAPRLAPGAVVVGAGMTRHIHTSTSTTFEQVVGPTTTSLARRKARLIHPQPSDDVERTLAGAADPRDPAHWPRFALPGSEAVVVSGPAVFSAGKLDIGTRLLLDHLATRSFGDGVRAVVDLGCGNGAIGLAVLRTEPEAQVCFVDESSIAVRSAQETVRANDVGTGTLAGRSRFLLSDALDTSVAADLDGEGTSADRSNPAVIEPGSVDLVVINPPFHDDHAIGDDVAWRMFRSARRVLRSGGEVLVVGNRHLGYHAKLTRLFGNVNVVASNPKFVVLSAIA